MKFHRVEAPEAPTAEQLAAVEILLGRLPEGAFRVVVVDGDGAPVVIENEPFLANGRPMPTRYWLLGRDVVRAVSRIEGDGGVRRAEAEVDPEALRQTHEAYAAARNALIDPAYQGPRPSGGVGGTRRGVKCLHTHLAHHLAVGSDPVGAWVLEHLDQLDQLEPQPGTAGSEVAS